MGRFGSSKHSSFELSSPVDEEQPTIAKRDTAKKELKKIRFINTSKLLSINTIDNLVKLQEKIQQTNKKGLP
jgi:hypothetical protein